MLGHFSEADAGGDIPDLSRIERDVIKRIDLCCQRLRPYWNGHTRLWTWEITGTLFDAARAHGSVSFARPQYKPEEPARRDYGFEGEVFWDVLWAPDVGPTGNPIGPLDLTAEVEWAFGKFGKKEIDAFRWDCEKLTYSNARTKLLICEEDPVDLGTIVASAPGSGRYLRLLVPGDPSSELILTRWDSGSRPQ